MASHTGHNHPATPAARAACRRGDFSTDTGYHIGGQDVTRRTRPLAPMSATVARVVMVPDDTKGPGYFNAVDYTATLVTITEPHCQQCGNTDEGVAYNSRDGYTGCCNERIISNGPRMCDPAECFHDETELGG